MTGTEVVAFFRAEIDETSRMRAGDIEGLHIGLIRASQVNGSDGDVLELIPCIGSICDHWKFAGDTICRQRCEGRHADGFPKSRLSSERIKKNAEARERWNESSKEGGDSGQEGREKSSAIFFWLI